MNPYQLKQPLYVIFVFTNHKKKSRYNLLHCKSSFSIRKNNPLMCFFPIANTLSQKSSQWYRHLCNPVKKDADAAPHVELGILDFVQKICLWWSRSYLSSYNKYIYMCIVLIIVMICVCWIVLKFLTTFT